MPFPVEDIDNLWVGLGDCKLASAIYRCTALWRPKFFWKEYFFFPFLSRSKDYNILFSQYVDVVNDFIIFFCLEYVNISYIFDLIFI